MGSDKAKAIQLVLFLAESSHMRADGLFSTFFGMEPDNFSSRKPTMQDPTTSIATGMIEEAVAEIRVQLGRVDFVLSAPDVEGLAEGSEYDSLISFSKYTRRMLEYLDRAADSLPRCFRLALVGAVIWPVGTLTEAQKLLLDCIGFDVPVASDTTDLSFSLNKRVMLDDRQTVLNRLLRYNCVETRIFQILPPSPVMSEPISQNTYGMHLTVDINTVPTNIIYERERMRTTFHAMGDELLRIGVEGKLNALYHF